MSRNNATKPSSACLKLHQLAEEAGTQLHLRKLFESDKQRFGKFSYQSNNILLDLSKQHITEEVMQHLIALAKEQKVESKRDAMFRGDFINHTENRQALHTSLRSQDKAAPYYDEVQKSLTEFLTFAELVRADQNMVDIVNIGIGGSDLGPRMAVQALSPYQDQSKKYHFISNIDPHETSEVLSSLDPNKTLFIITSKSFTTPETLTNAETAKSWFHAAGGKNVSKHFVGITTNVQAAEAFGIKQTFAFSDWVGGRYSLWSPVGISLAIAIGKENFLSFLSGAQAIDEHFQKTPIEKNIPILLSLIDVWNRNFLKRPTRCIAPYSHGLRALPAYLQQLEMESNGKSTHQDGSPLNHETAGITWGEAGSNGQHAFFQMLHQGSDIIPVDFILINQPSIFKSSYIDAVKDQLIEQHKTLKLNALAQARALMVGKDYDDALKELQGNNVNGSIPNEILARHKTHTGNKPSSVILLQNLSPFNLGALLALHEHRTFVSAALWDINSFDQWGVELGKSIVKALKTNAKHYTDPELNLDSSTLGLLKEIN